MSSFNFTFISLECSSWATIEVVARKGPRMSADIVAREIGLLIRIRFSHLKICRKSIMQAKFGVACFLWSQLSRKYLISLFFVAVAVVVLLCFFKPSLSYYSNDVTILSLSASDQRLYCEVTVAQPHALLLETTDHVMYIGDPPLRLTISAQDAEGISYTGHLNNIYYS